jgi:hypothetical protein
MDAMKKTAAILIIAGLTAGLAGCAGSCRTTRTIERGSLREAMRKASDTEDRDKKVADSRQSHEHTCGFLHWGCNHHDDDDVVIVNVHGEHSAPHRQHHAPSVAAGMLVPRNRFFALRANSAACYSDEYERILGGAVMFAAETQGARHGLELGASLLPHTFYAESRDAVDNLVRIHAGYQYRHMLAPEAIALQPFFLAGGGLTSLVWNYNESIESDVIDEWGRHVRTDIISHDGLMGVSGEAGFGMKLLDLQTVGLSVESALGVTGYSEETFEAFHNDLFAGDFYGRVGFEIAFGNME